MNEATKPETGYPDIEGSDFFKGNPIKKAEDVVMEGLLVFNITLYFIKQGKQRDPDAKRLFSTIYRKPNTNTLAVLIH